MPAQCYGYRMNSTKPEDAANPTYVFPLISDWAVPCPSDGDDPSVACCRPGDKCLSNNICGYVDHVPAGYSYPYYMASCTDPSFTADVCPRICTTQVQPGIVYNSTSKEWACCGTLPDGESFTCNKPTDLTFSAPEPDQLTSHGIAGATSEKGKTLSTAAIAGIGAGAGVAALLLIAILVWLLLRYRKKRRTQGEARAWIAGGKPAGSHQNPRLGIMQDVTPANESPKHEYHSQAEEMLPMYTDGRVPTRLLQNPHSNVAELGGRETTSLMGRGAELEAIQRAELEVNQRVELEAYRR